MKYVLYSGYVISVNDGEKHFVPAHKLIKLYGLNEKDCILDKNPNYLSGPMLQGIDYIVLGPRVRGDYKEHLEEKLKGYV